MNRFLIIILSSIILCNCASSVKVSKTFDKEFNNIKRIVVLPLQTEVDKFYSSEKFEVDSIYTLKTDSIIKKYLIKLTIRS